MAYSSLASILGAEGERKTRRARRRYDRTAARRKRQAAARRRARHKRQREHLQELARETIPKLERRQARLSSLGRTETAGLFGEDPEIRRQRRLSEVESNLDAAWDERAQLAWKVRRRRGRRAEPVTLGEAALAIGGAFPPLRAGAGVAVGLRALLRGGGTKATTEAAEQTARAGFRGTAAKTARARTGVSQAESRAATRAAGGRVKPVQKGVRGPARRTAARRARRKAAGEPRTTRIPRSRAEAGARARRTYKAHKPAVLSKAGRQVRRRQRVQTLTTAAAASPPGAAIVVEGVKRYAEAVADNPVKVAETTARIVPGMATAIASLPADVVAAIAQGDTGPLKGQVQGQVEYWEKVAEIVGNDPEAAKRVIQEDLGLVPALSAGLTGYAAGRLAGVRTPSVREARLRKLEEQRTSPDRATRMRAQRKLEEMPATQRQSHADKVRESKRAAATGERIEKQFGREMREGGRGKNRIDRQLEALNRKRLTEKVTEADVAMFLGREGLAGLAPERLLAELARRKGALIEPKREIRPDDVATRDVIAALERHPEAATDPALLRFLDDYEAMQAGRSVERHAERTGRPQRTTDPEDERARLLHAARAEGIELPEERIPLELRGVSRTRPERGVEARAAIRGEAGKARRTAKTARQKARVEQERARGATRELNVRRVADERRVATRSLDTGLRRLEERRAAWQTKADRARTPETKRRYQAKVRDLDAQIRDRRARLALSASPARLRAVERVTEHRGRERELRAGAEAEMARAAKLESVVNRERRAGSLDRQARAEERAGRLGAAAELRAEATALRRREVESQRALSAEFAAQTRGRISEKSLREPIYFAEVDVTNKGALNVMGDYPGSQIPKKDHQRMGELARQGRIDEAGATLLENAYRGRVAIEMRTHARSYLDERLIDVEGGKIHTGATWRRLQAEGKLPPGSALIPLQEFQRVLARGEWDEAAGLLDDSLRANIREARLVDGRKYAAVSRASLEEFRDQMKPYGRTLRHVRTLARIQSIALLFASPAWFAYQLVASPLAALVRHPNPLRWARATRTYIKEWRKIPERERINYQVQYGSTTAEAIALQRTQIGLRPDTVRQMASAAGIALRSPVGRLLDSIVDQARKGGPFIQANRRYEAKVRDFVALVEMDKQIRPSAALRFADSVGKAHKLVARDLAHLKDKPLREQVAYYDKNSKARNRLADAVDDAVGNWNALTKAERAAAAVTVFFPFLRFSLRFLFVTMPRDRPITTAVLANLSQVNAEQLEGLLEGGPSLFQNWGQIVVHVSEDNPVAINLARAAPGSNAIVEAFGSSGINLASATRPFQPVISGGLTALAGQDPLSGRESRLSRGELFARAIVGLPTPLRPVARQIGPEPSDYSKLLSEITGRQGQLSQYLLPQILTDLGKEREAAKASRLMDAAFGDNDAEARAELDRMLVEYGIRPEAGESGGGIDYEQVFSGEAEEGIDYSKVFGGG